MVSLGETFTAQNTPEPKNFEPVPPGWYNVQVKESSLENSKSGGQYIKLQLAITGPTHAGRVVYTNINIRNDNTVAVEIGRQQIGKIVRATGVQLSDTDQFVGLQFQAKMAIQTDPTGQHEPRNEVKDFKAIDNGMPQQMPQQMPAQTPQQAPPQAPPAFAQQAPAQPAYTQPMQAQGVPQQAPAQAPPPWAQQGQ